MGRNCCKRRQLFQIYWNTQQVSSFFVDSPVFIRCLHAPYRKNKRTPRDRQQCLTDFENVVEGDWEGDQPHHSSLSQGLSFMERKLTCYWLCLQTAVNHDENRKYKWKKKIYNNLQKVEKYQNKPPTQDALWTCQAFLPHRPPPGRRYAVYKLLYQRFWLICAVDGPSMLLWPQWTPQCAYNFNIGLLLRIDIEWQW